jgi:glycosyltransferase involved in cell wall biosynthesis
MRVMQISFFADARRRSPEELLSDWHSLEDVAASVASTGARVTVVQASLSPGQLARRGVEYVFMPPDSPKVPLAQCAAFGSLLRDRRPDVVHVHGLGFPRDVLALHELAPHLPILLQDHADRPPRFWRRAVWRRGMAVAAGISFCAHAQADPFTRAGVLSSEMRVFEIPESTSTFTPGDVVASRAATGLNGDPAVLWVGHLDRNKDPLTVLDGIAIAAADLPGLQLWCCFGAAPLLPAVEACIAREPRLRDRVHLLGRVAHERVETLMRAADLFVLGSHREGSSFSLIEALATGLTPVVTDIPSLRALTNNGAVGRLWRVGDSRALAGALRAAAASLGPRSRGEVRAHFDVHLSSDAIGRKFVAAYASLNRTALPVGLSPHEEAVQ